MLKGLDIGRIIGMKQAGKSNRETSRITGYDRGKISQVWNRYCAQVTRLGEAGVDVKAIQAEMTGEPKYNSAGRVRWRYTEEVAARLGEILEGEEEKTRRLGARHKQRLTNLQIHEKLVSEGFEVGRVTINNELAKLRKKFKEVYIRQQYDFGDRLEYDFGEVKLNCGGGVKVYHMAVFASPGGQFRWAYLYTNQKQGVFLDSHVKFFDEMGGVWREVVYDNMKNVVKKFIGKNEKELNKELVQMAAYYGYEINVTNCFSGNEKGSVENSVKVLRNKIFAGNYTFASLNEAREYMRSRLLKLNESSKIDEEKQHLLAYRPPLELAVLSRNTVNPYSMICVDTAFYSVPEEYVGKNVSVKKYHDEIRVYANDSANGEEICRHNRIFGKGCMTVDISHYLNSLLRKPGAIRNSAALKGIPKLKAIFDTHYAKEPKKFIEIFLENKELPIQEIIERFGEKTSGDAKSRAELRALDVVKPLCGTEVRARAVIMSYAQLVNAGVK